MKQIKVIILLSALALLAACKQERVEPTGGAADNAVVQIAPSVGGLLTRSNPMGDAQAQTRFNPGDQIAVSAGTQPEVIYTLQADGTTWTPEEGKMLLWETATMEFKAYYPVEHKDSNGYSNDASFSTFTVPVSQNASDYTSPHHIHWADRMTFSGTVTRTGASPAATFTMKRQMARVIVKITEVGNVIDAEKAQFDYLVYSRLSLSSLNTISISGYVENGGTSSKTDDVITTLVIPSAEDKTVHFLTVTVIPDRTNPSVFYNLYIKGKPAYEAGKSYTYNVKVGKDKIEIASVTVEEWTSGGILPGGAAEAMIEVNPDTHTLTVLKPGFLTTNHIATALNGGTVLTVSGTLNADDVAKLTATTSLTGIDLRGVTYPAATRAVGTVPSADWSGCTALRAILINPADAAAYKAAWSAASDKLLYLGKERVHKVDAMTDELNKNGVPCVVIGITGFESHRLISRNPYCNNLNEDKIGIFGTSGMSSGSVYSKLDAIIKLWGGKVATLDDLKALVPLRPNSFTEVTKEENGNSYTSIPDDYFFVVNSDGSQYVKKYTYNKDTKEFTLGWQYDTVDNYSNGQITFITFDVTNP